MKLNAIYINTIPSSTSRIVVPLMKPLKRRFLVEYIIAVNLMKMREGCRMMGRSVMPPERVNNSGWVLYAEMPAYRSWMTRGVVMRACRVLIRYPRIVQRGVGQPDGTGLRSQRGCMG